MRRVWWVAILCAAAVHGQQRQAGQGVNFYSKEKEIALGQKLSAEFRRHTTPLDNVAASDYVRRVGANLAAQLPGGWTYQFELIQDDMGGSTREPTAFPGGYLFVSQHLIGAAQNEAEFAGMLAHAMAHVAARHGTRQMTKVDLLQIGANSMPNGSTGNLPVPLGMLAFQRASEREADYLAVQAMAAAGYDPEGLASCVGREQAPAKNPEFEPLPQSGERVAAINKEIGGLPQRTYQAGDEFARVRASILK